MKLTPSGPALAPCPCADSSCINKEFITITTIATGCNLQRKLLMEIQWILFEILCRAIDWLHAARASLLQVSFFFFSSNRVASLLFLSCSAAQVQRQSKTPVVNHGHGENKSRSPDAGGVHSTADDRTLIKNGCTAYWAQVPGPAQARRDQTRRDCLPALYMARQNRKRNGTRRGMGTRRLWRTEERVLLARLLIYVRMRTALAPYSGAP